MESMGSKGLIFLNIAELFTLMNHSWCFCYTFPMISGKDFIRDAKTLGSRKSAKVSTNRIFEDMFFPKRPITCPMVYSLSFVILVSEDLKM